MADTDTVFRIVVDSGGAVKAIKEVSTAQGDLVKSTQQASLGFSDFEKKIITLNQASQLLTTGLSAVESITKGVFDALGQAQRIEGLTASFNNLQASVGVLGSQSLSGLSKATQGLVSNLELMQSANQAVLLGVDKGTGDFEKMAAAAVKLGQATGRTATEALNDLTVGVGRQSKLILDNLGVLVDAEKANQKYAAVNDLVSESLTDQQRALAFQQEAFAQITEKANKLAEVQDTAGLATTRLTSAWENQKNTLIETLSQNEGLRDSINSLATTVSNLDLKPLINDLAEVAKAAVELTNKVLGLVDTFNTMRLGVDVTKEFAAQFESFKDQGNNMFTALANSSQIYNKALDEVAKRHIEQDKALKNAGESIKSNTQAIDDSNKKLTGTKGNWESFFSKTSKYTIETKSLEAASRKHADAMQRQSDQFAKLNSADGIIGATGKIASLTTEWIKGTIQANEYDKAVKKINADLRSAGVTPARVEEIDDAGVKAGKAGGSSSQVAKTGLGKIFEGTDFEIDTENPLFQSISSAVGSSIERGLEEGFNRDSLKSLGTEIGTALGNYAGIPFSGALASKISNAVFDIGKSSRKTFKGATTIVDTIFPGIGTALDAGLGKMFGDSAATSARKQADKFFSTLFEEESLAVIINGKLQRVSSLVFKGNQEGGLFSTLSTDVQSQFQAVGTALEEALGLGEGAAVNLSNVLANNLGGDLNNLQQLIIATGVTFEELSEKMLQTFYEGEVSALQLAQRLQEINDLMAVGIPGATGAVGVAFDNIAKAGFNGGRILFDALKDVGAEAQELGIKDFPQLANRMVQVFGISAQQVEQFFQAAKVAGLNNVAELVSASTQQLAALAANLQQITSGAAPSFTGESLGGESAATKAVKSYGGGGGSRRYSSPTSRTSTKSKPQDKFKDITLSVIPELAKVAVKGMDDAARQILSADDQLTRALGKGFFDQFGGDLNKIGVIADSLGITFQELQKSIVNSFKAGKSSATDAATALNDAMQGIPGVIGATDEAVKNLIKGGLQGGNFSLDALRDIGAEALEAGVKPISQEERERLIKERTNKKLVGRNVTSELQKAAEAEATIEIDKENDPLTKLYEHMIGKGVNGKTAKQIVDQFRAFGADTLDEITHLSDETGVRIIDGLNRSGFAFEQTSQDLINLQNRLNEATQEKEMKIKINITKGTIDPELTKELKKYGISASELRTIIHNAQREGGTKPQRAGKPPSQP